MDASALALEAVTETYEDVKEHVRAEAGRFWHRYGGDLDTLVADANYAFMQAYERYRPELGPFIPHVRYIVWVKLFDPMRHKCFTKARTKQEPMNMEEHIDSHPTPDRLLEEREAFAEWLKELSLDAKTVVRLLLDAPRELREDVLCENIATATGRDKKGGARREMRGYLRDVLQWPARRITESFREIQVALSWKHRVGE